MPTLTIEPEVELATKQNRARVVDRVSGLFIHLSSRRVFKRLRGFESTSGEEPPRAATGSGWIAPTKQEHGVIVVEGCDFGRTTTFLWTADHTGTVVS